MPKLIYILVLAVVLFPCISMQVEAAQITVSGVEIQGRSVVFVRGTFELGDDEHFTNVVLNLDHARIVFDSPGGNLSAGLGMGKTIRLKKFETAVEQGRDCASACALAWLGGSRRIILLPGRVGFHAAFLTDGQGKSVTSGTGNALVGAYLNSLGMTSYAIQYLTEKPPTAVNWLDADLGRILGIDAEYLNPSSETTTAAGQADTSKVADNPVQFHNDGKTPAPPVAPAQSTPGSDQFILVKDRDIYGGDLKLIKEIGSVAQCQMLCSTSAQCMAFTYNLKADFCFLKSSGTRVWWTQDSISGFSPALSNRIKFYSLVLRPNSVVGGSTLSSLSNSSIEDCADVCTGQSKCSGFSFARTEGGLCTLKTGKLRFRHRRGGIAGVKTLENSQPN